MRVYLRTHKDVRVSIDNSDPQVSGRFKFFLATYVWNTIIRFCRKNEGMSVDSLKWLQNRELVVSIGHLFKNFVRMNFNICVPWLTLWSKKMLCVSFLYPTAVRNFEPWKRAGSLYGFLALQLFSELFQTFQLYLKTNRERHKSAPYLRLRNSRTSKCQVLSFTVPEKPNSWTKLARRGPRALQGGPFRIF